MEFVKRYLDSLEIDFVAKRKVAMTFSAILVTLSWVAFAVIGPNWGIDFTGGTEIHLRFADKVEINEVRSALRTLGLSDDTVQAINGTDSNEFAVRIQDAEFGMEELRIDVESILAESFGADWVEDLAVNAEVGARFVVTHKATDRQDLRTIDGVLASGGLPDAQVQNGKEEHEIVILVPGLAQRIQERIAEAIGDREFEVLSIDAVGPKVGGELRRQGFISIAATLGLVLLYVGFRFDIGFAPGAILALFHDVSITIGIFVLTQLEFSLPMIGALLTIVGYSLNDTIVIYDRIRENRDRYRRTDLPGLINVSINETLTRTVATSVTTLCAITMFMLIGGPVIRNFAFAMFLGIIFGTYSTMFVASPMILIMEDVKPWLSKLVAAPARATEPDPADTVPDSALTESEKRRRARAEAEKRGQE